MHKFRYLVLSLIVSVLALSAVSAVGQKDVAYILEDSSQVSGNVILSLNKLGLSYDVIRDSQIAATDFSNYGILLVTENVDRKDLIPFEEVPAIFFDRTVATEVWPGLQTSFTTNARQVKVVDQNNLVFKNISVPADGVINVYTPSAGAPMHYIKIKPSYVYSLAIRTSENRPVLAYSERELGGNTIRDVFFGLIDSNNWNSQAQKVFENSLVYLMASTDHDGDGFGAVNDCNDGDMTIYPGAEETPYDMIDQDCDGFDLLDVDGDGFCGAGYMIQNSVFQCPLDNGLVGTDCDDEDFDINSNNPDLVWNCVNDAPSFEDVPQDLVYDEGELVSFEVSAYDPEGDDLAYFVNDSRFVVNGNVFSWQTGYADAGIHYFTLTVTDGTFSDSREIAIEILNVNSPPIASFIPIQFWDEDTSYSLDLGDYFAEADGESMTFGIASLPNENNVDVELEGSLVTFTPAENFFGSEHIKFYADDGNAVTYSNDVALVVENVNDAPSFEGTIEDAELNEDHSLVDAIDLNDYFSDIDSVLSYEVFGNSQISVSIEDGIVSFVPAPDYSGTEEIYFRASDGEYDVLSNTFNVVVHGTGEPPSFLPLNCSNEIDEDSTHSCTLDAVDPDGDEFDFSVVNETHLACEVDGNELTYVPAENYVGLASCVLKVESVDGEDVLNFEVGVLPVNDAPRIDAYDPEEDDVYLVIGNNKTFSIESSDVDSSLITSWYLGSDLVLQNSDSHSLFTLISPTAGNYLLEAIVSDGDLQANRAWNVHVGQTSDFTCSQAGGNVCSEGSVCSGALLDVLDSEACCATSCIPSFDDADPCDEISDKVSVVIDSLEEYDFGDTAKVEFEVDNDYEKDQNFDIDVYLYNLNSDKVEEKTDTSYEIKDKGSRTFRLDLPIPLDLDGNDEYVVFVKAKDDVCAQDYKKISLKRIRDKVVLDSFDLPNSAVCGESVDAKVKLENFGSNDAKVKLSLENSKLKVKELEELNLDRFGDDKDRESAKFSFDIPEGIDSGTYELRATATYTNGRIATLTKSIDVECEAEQVRSVEQNSDSLNDQKLTLNQIGEIVKKVEKKDYSAQLIFATLNVFLILSVMILYLAYKKKH